MEYSDIENKVKAYRHKLFIEWVNNNPDIEFKIGEVVTRHVYRRDNENDKKWRKLFKEHLYVGYVSVQGDKFKGYFLDAITPTGRVSKVHGMFFDPLYDVKVRGSLRYSYKEKLTPYCDSIDIYKEKIGRNKK